MSCICLSVCLRSVPASTPLNALRGPARNMLTSVSLEERSYELYLLLWLPVPVSSSLANCASSRWTATDVSEGRRPATRGREEGREGQRRDGRRGGWRLRSVGPRVCGSQDRSGYLTRSAAGVLRQRPCSLSGACRWRPLAARSKAGPAREGTATIVPTEPIANRRASLELCERQRTHRVICAHRSQRRQFPDALPARRGGRSP